MSDLVKQISIKNSSGDEWETRDIGVDADNVEGLIDYINNSGEDTQISNLTPTGVTSGNYGSTGTSQYAINGEHNNFTAFGATLQSDGRASSANNTVYSIDATKKYKLENQESEFSDKNSFFLGEGANDLYNELNGKIFYGTAIGSEPDGEVNTIYITVEDNSFQKGLSTGTILIVDFGRNIGTFMSNRIAFIINGGDREYVSYIDSIIFETIRFDGTVFPFVYYENDGGSWKFINTPVTRSSIGELSITRDKIVNFAINEDKIDNGAITAGKIADDAVSADNLKCEVGYCRFGNTTIDNSPGVRFGGAGFPINTLSQFLFTYRDSSGDPNPIPNSYISSNSKLTLPAGKGVLKFFVRITSNQTIQNDIYFFGGVATQLAETGQDQNIPRGNVLDIYRPNYYQSISGVAHGYSSSGVVTIPFNNSEPTTYYFFGACNIAGVGVYPQVSYILFKK